MSYSPVKLRKRRQRILHSQDETIYCENRNNISTINNIVEGKKHSQQQQYLVEGRQKDIIRTTTRSVKSVLNDQHFINTTTRTIQESVDLDICVVTIQRCQFYQNMYNIQKIQQPNNDSSSRSSSSNRGLIHVNSSFTDLTVTASIFRNNNYGPDDNVGNDNVVNDDNITGINNYAIWIESGSRLYINNNCFVYNLFTGRGAVIVNDDYIYAFQSSGNYGTLDPTLQCPYLSIGSSPTFNDTTNSFNYECWDYEGTSCIPDPSLSVESTFVSPTPTTTIAQSSSSSSNQDNIASQPTTTPTTTPTSSSRTTILSIIHARFIKYYLLSFSIELIFVTSMLS